MKVRKSDSGLAVELPEKLVEELGIKEGDDVEVRLTPSHKIEIDKPLRREEALQLLHEASHPLPPDYKFNREELHERGPRLS
jgi:antitoxin MazE